MKKSAYCTTLGVFLALICMSCHSCNKPSLRDKIQRGVTDRYVVQREHIVASTDTLIPIGREEFTLIAAYIVHHGFTVVERGVASDRKFIFYDASKNRHALIAIRRDEQNLPSLEAPVSQISVWVNSEDAKPGKEIFYYLIYPDYILMPKSSITHLQEVQKAYKQLLILAGSK